MLGKAYNSKCPVDRPDGALYLKALKYPKGEVWYQKMPVGHNVLSKMISRMMSSANISGHFTNHSLRSTATTRLFNAHLDEQLIMARTGHSSVKGVRSYKHIGEQLVEETSDILNKKVRVEKPVIETQKVVETPAVVEPPVVESSSVVLNFASFINSIHGSTITFNVRMP